MSIQDNGTDGNTFNGATVETLKAEYAAAGGNPNTLTHQRGELRARAKGQAQVRQQARGASDPRYEVIATIVKGALYFVAVLFVSILAIVGILYGSYLLMAAEIAAVTEGLKVIDPARAASYAFAITVFYVVMLFVREVLAQHATRGEMTRVLSLRQLGSWLIYFIGMGQIKGHGEEWRARYKVRRTLLTRADTTVGLFLWAQALFGVMGRLVPMITSIAPDAAWHEALTKIVTEATLPDMLGLIGAPLMTIALLTGMHFIVHFVYQLFVSLTGGINTVDFFEVCSPGEIVEGEVLAYWMVERERQKAKLALKTGTNGETALGA